MQVPERPLDPAYRIEALADAAPGTGAEVVAFWLREGVLTDLEARHRLEQVLLVAIEAHTGAVVGVASAYLQGNVSLRTDCWYFRVFVSPAHRHSNAAVQLAVHARDLLEQRFVSGRDRSAAGVVYEIENTNLMHQFRQGVWPQTQVAFIGEDQRGAHIRVRYFAGATVGVPDAAEGDTDDVDRLAPHMAAPHRIEVVRGRLTDDQADQLRTFWEAHGALTGDAATQRLAQVVCIALDDDGAIVGACSVYDAAVPLIGGRRFWVYRHFAPGLDDETQMQLLGATYDALASEHGGDPTAPLGLCALIDDPRFMRRHPEAVWADNGLFHAGYLPDGRQVRLRYFPEARIA